MKKLKLMLMLMFSEEEINEKELDEKYISTFLPPDFSSQDYPFGKDMEFQNKRIIIETEGMSDEQREKLREEYKNYIYKELTGSHNKVIVSFSNEEIKE